MFEMITNPTPEDAVDPISVAIRSGFITMVSVMPYMELHHEHPAIATLSMFGVCCGMHYYSARKALENFKKRKRIIDHPS